MDPNANVTEQREIAMTIAGNPSKDADANRLAELVLALSDWRKSGGFSPADPLTITDAINLGSLLDACQRTAPVTWIARYPDNNEQVKGANNTVTGTLRAIVGDDKGRGFINHDKDVREGFVWISSTFEFFLPVRLVLGWMREETFILDYRA